MTAVYYYIGDHARFIPLPGGMQLEILNSEGNWIIQDVFGA